MKKRGMLLLTLLFAFGLFSGCGAKKETSSTGETQTAEETPAPDVTEEEAEEETEETESGSEAPESSGEDAAADAGTETSEEGGSGSNILIAYFTWAENTYVENPEEVDVDASTSASVLPPGNAALLAGWIQEEVGGDLFSIVVTEPYSSDYDECLDRAAEEKAANARPELVNHVENMEDYDIVFLGFPNWWYTVPMAVHSFLEEYDFSGKTIVPFVTHGTGGLSGTIEDITADLPESAAILEPIGVYRPEVASAQPQIQDWLAGLGLEL